MPPLLRVVGYAIVSGDGMIADATGTMPPAIINEADQQFFAHGLDEADVVVHGRNSQERQRNSPRRQRLVLTRRIAALARHPDNSKALLWNPDGVTLEDACEALGVSHGVAAIIGGTEVFGLFLPRYDAFHLTRAAQARIPSGRPVFPGIPPHTPEELLGRQGLRPYPVRVLDAAADVSVSTWRR
ncbi:MAG: dihydrofolate reductase [Rhizobiales bacterium]|nr:dihydrofolate reductase [Hyphomicrobiales bacterium]